MESQKNEISLEDYDLFFNSSVTTKRIVQSWTIKTNVKELKIPADGLSSPQMKVKFTKKVVSWALQILPNKTSGLDIEFKVLLDQLEEESTKSLRFFFKLCIIDNRQLKIAQIHKHLSVINETKFIFNVDSNEKPSTMRSMLEGNLTLKCYLYFLIDPDDECKKFIVSELDYSNETKNNYSKWKNVLFHLCLKLTEQVISYTL